MKSQHHTYLATRACRLAMALLLGIVLLTSVGCLRSEIGAKEAANAEAIEQLEGRFDQLESGLSGLVFWQATAALLFVLSGFALVGGAALGSRARRDQAGLPAQPQPETSPLDEPSA
jgi:hypothetical protein